MDPLTWTGALGAYIDPIFTLALLAFLVFTACYFVATFASDEPVPELAHTPFARTKDWKLGSATALGELTFPAVSLGLIFFVLDTALSETTLHMWLAGSGMPWWLSTFLSVIVFGVIGLFLTYTIQRLPVSVYEVGVRWSFIVLLVLAVVYVVLGSLMPVGSAGIIGAMAKQLLPVWILLIVTFALSIHYTRRLGLSGRPLGEPGEQPGRARGSGPGHQQLPANGHHRWRW